MQKYFSLHNALLAVGVLMVFNADLKAQQGYSLDFHVKGWSDTTVYLAYYYGQSTYIKDTARVNTTGQCSFKSNEPLPQGMYMLVMDKTRAFEFLIGEDQQFELSTDSTHYVKHMKIKGDVNNEVLYDHIRYLQTMNKKAQHWEQHTKDSLATDQQKETAQTALTNLNEEVADHFAQLSKMHEGTLIATILKAQQKIEVPQNLDESQQVHYYKSHFWDYFDLSNDAFLRMPNSLYQKKIEEYLDNWFVQSPDSLKAGIEYVISHARSNPETYKYAVWNICLKYQNPQYMGLDELFVYLYDNYFASGQMDFWADESLKNNLKEHTDQLRKSLIGVQAQNMIMLDENLQRVSLYNIKKKYTVIYFYDPDCGHCKKETPKLHDFYKSTRHDVEVFAVSADTSMVKMKEYIKDLNLEWISVNGPRTVTPHYQKLYDANTTPTIYLLDEEKKIIAKKLEAARLEEFLDNYERSM